MSRYKRCKFTPAPDPELICGICRDVLDTPYETPCHHVFCRECCLKAVKKHRKCPVCRAPCRKRQCNEVLPLVQNLINKLTMRCDNFDNGCTDLILKEFFLDHVKSCEYAMIQCRYKSCGQYMLKRDIENHELNTCAYRDRLCNNGCGLMIPMENANSHNCVKALVALVKDLKEKNLDLQKRVDQLQQAPVIIVKSESPLAPGSSRGYHERGLQGLQVHEGQSERKHQQRLKTPMLSCSDILDLGSSVTSVSSTKTMKCPTVQ